MTHSDRVPIESGVATTESDMAMSERRIDLREKRPTRLHNWAHRHGIARALTSTRCSSFGFVEECVETALPWRWLALYASRHYGLRVVAVEPYGVLRRRWLLKPQGARRL